MKGGFRPGAGRKPGFGKWGCRTVLLRVPEHLKADVLAYVATKLNESSGGTVSVASNVLSKPSGSDPRRTNNEKAK